MTQPSTRSAAGRTRAAKTGAQYETVTRREYLVYDTASSPTKYDLHGTVVHHVENPIDAAQAWLKANEKSLSRYPGKWIGIGPDGLVAVADSLADARARAEQQGVGREELLVFRLPLGEIKRAVSTRRR